MKYQKSSNLEIRIALFRRTRHRKMAQPIIYTSRPRLHASKSQCYDMVYQVAVGNAHFKSNLTSSLICCKMADMIMKHRKWLYHYLLAP